MSECTRVPPGSRRGSLDLHPNCRLGISCTLQNHDAHKQTFRQTRRPNGYTLEIDKSFLCVSCVFIRMMDYHHAWECFRNRFVLCTAYEIYCSKRCSSVVVVFSYVVSVWSLSCCGMYVVVCMLWLWNTCGVKVRFSSFLLWDYYIGVGCFLLGLIRSVVFLWVVSCEVSGVVVFRVPCVRGRDSNNTMMS